MSQFFVVPTELEPATLAKSADINAITSAVDSAFNKLPTEIELKTGTVNYAVDTGTANAYLVALPYAPASYSDGLSIEFKALNTNTGAATINVNGLGVKSIRLADGHIAYAGDITVGVPVTLRYSSTTGFFHISANSVVSANRAEASAAAALISEGLADADAIATAADKVSTNADAVATAADKVATNADVVLAEADKVQTGLDRIATAADLVSTNQDTIDTAADLVLTNADVVLTHADVILAEADKVQTGLDKIATNADVVLTHADVVLTHADVVLAEADKVQTGLDRVQTGLDRVATNADLVLTNADVVLTHADVVLAEADKVQTGLDRAAVAADLVLTNADVVLTAADVVSAESAKTAAEAAQAAAELAADNFDDTYLGAKASDPTLNNDGDALAAGDLYFNTTSNDLKVYSGAAWIAIADGLPTQTGNAGKFLTTDATNPSWATLDTDANTTTKALYENNNTISANYAITAGNNAMSAGPLTINNGISVTVPTGSSWVIV